MPTYQRSTVNTADDVRAIADHAGSHFFDPETMKFFTSRLEAGVYPAASNEHGSRSVEGAVFFFVTSERHGNPGTPRHYAVRRMTLQSVRDDRPAVDITTEGDYHRTKREAQRAADKYAQSN